ncbi:Uncharacterised protein [Actinomyces denticolens]|nr:Uncharacterised protein [Actinomyces denticolens]
MLGVGKGYVMLVDEGGSYQVLDVKDMLGGGLVWNETGLFFSGRNDEYHVDGSGVTSFPRGVDEGYEVGGYSTSDSQGYMAFYSRAGVQSVIVGDKTGIKGRSDQNGMFASNGHCGDRVVSIVNTGYAPDIGSRITLPDSNGPFDALVQVYPHAEGGDLPVILGTDEHDDSLDAALNYYTCDTDVIYVPTAKRSHPQADPGNGLDPTAATLVIQAWDTSSGQRRIIPVIDASGTPLDFSSQDISGAANRIIDGELQVVTREGEAYRVELPTGALKSHFSIPLSDELSFSQFAFMDAYVFVLDVPADPDADLTMSRYGMSSGEASSIMAIHGASRFRSGGLLVDDPTVQSIALRPGYTG